MPFPGNGVASMDQRRRLHRSKGWSPVEPFMLTLGTQRDARNVQYPALSASRAKVAQHHG
jgi:hypothetical protein